MGLKNIVKTTLMCGLVFSLLSLSGCISNNPNIEYFPPRDVFDYKSQQRGDIDENPRLVGVIAEYKF